MGESERHFLVELLFFFIFHAIRLLWNCVIFIIWRLTEISVNIKLNKQAERYDRCAQVLDIVWKYNFDVLALPQTTKHFILKHNQFTHPKYVLKDEVTLYYITKDEAIFVEAPSGVDVNQLIHSAFHKQAQFDNAIRLVVMPLYAFHRLAAEIGDPKGQLVFMDFQPRSGSTLMSQIFEATGKCVNISEAYVPMSISEAANKRGGQFLVEDIQSMVRLICKPKQQGNEPLAYIFRNLVLTQQCLEEVEPILKEKFPSAKFLLVYRNVKDSTQSITRVRKQLKMTKILEIFSLYQPKWQAKISAAAWFSQEMIEKGVKDIVQRSSDPQILLSYIWTARFTRNDPNPKTIQKAAVKYEHLVANPTDCLKAIFPFCGLSEDLVPLGLKGMEQDSQGGSVISQSRTHRHGDHKAPDESVLQDMDTIARLLNIPTYSEDLLLPNTITK